MVGTIWHEQGKTGATPEVGVKRIVELGTLRQDRPTAMWSTGDEAIIPQ